MFARNVAVVALSTLSLVSAANFTIDPNEVQLSTRATWCRAQTNSCDQLCGGSGAKVNKCTETDLTYTCTCYNGTAPGLEYYIQTMPTFICTQAWEDCNTENVGDAQGQENCTKTIKDQCGTLNPSDAKQNSGSSSTTTSSATGTATSGAAATTQASTSTSRAAAMPTSIQNIGNGAAVMAAGIFALML